MQIQERRYELQPDGAGYALLARAGTAQDHLTLTGLPDGDYSFTRYAKSGLPCPPLTVPVRGGTGRVRLCDIPQPFAARLTPSAD